MTNLFTVSMHADDDWCHLCGHRDRPTVDVFYAANAEHALRNPEGHQDRPKYFRVCDCCALAIEEASTRRTTTLVTKEIRDSKKSSISMKRTVRAHIEIISLGASRSVN